MASQNIKDFPSKLYDQPQEYLVDAEELSVNRLQLNFDVPINDIAKRDVKIKNIGNSAIYIKFNFKNSPRINCHGFKDIKSKFYCHYENTVIKPGEEITFFFSFISEFPGNFTEEVEISCQPPLKTMIPNLKLNGNASIKDEWENQRQGFNQNIDEVVLTNEVR